MADLKLQDIILPTLIKSKYSYKNATSMVLASNSLVTKFCFDFPFFRLSFLAKKSSRDDMLLTPTATWRRTFDPSLCACAACNGSAIRARYRPRFPNLIPTHAQANATHGRGRIDATRYYMRWRVCTRLTPSAAILAN